MRAVLVSIVVSATALADPIATPIALALPGGGSGIGFDDLMFAPSLHRVLAPGGGTGALDLIDPATKRIESVAGFSAQTTAFGGGHGDGTTSADAGAGVIFASDRGRDEVAIVDPKALKIVGRVKLAGGPDYVRWIDPVHELWITEPRAQQIEYFTFAKGTLVHAGAIDVPGGPEALAIDAARGRAYSNTWTDATVAIDLATHREVARWSNGCKGARGLALDATHGLVFVGCEEGKAVALDVAHGGKPVGSLTTGAGVDIIAYNPALGHLYVPGGDSATLTIIRVAGNGVLTLLGSVATATDAHCVATDDANHAYVCDPKRGVLLVVTDPFPR